MIDFPVRDLKPLDRDLLDRADLSLGEIGFAHPDGRPVGQIRIVDAVHLYDRPVGSGFAAFIAATSSHQEGQGEQAKLESCFHDTNVVFMVYDLLNEEAGKRRPHQGRSKVTRCRNWSS